MAQEKCVFDPVSGNMVEPLPSVQSLITAGCSAISTFCEKKIG